MEFYFSDGKIVQNFIAWPCTFVVIKIIVI